MANNKKRFETNSKGSLIFPQNSQSIRQYHANPCGCDDDFENRPEIFVDKQAPNGGDGLTLETAYNDLNKTISCNPNTKISIKGYGKNDPYETVQNVDCIYLNGLDDKVFVSMILDCDASRFDNINCHNSSLNGVSGCLNSAFNNCTANGNEYNGFHACKNSNFNNCTANDNECKRYYSYNSGGFATCNNSNFNNCTAQNNGTNGFGSSDYSEYNFCLANENSSHGFEDCHWSTFKNCTANNNISHGFDLARSTLESCTANGNGYYISESDKHYACGFYGLHNDYLNCTASGNVYHPNWKCDGTNYSHCNECKEG
ncbi:hypothetical protein AAEX28_04155 [Lentisphaerota bacterium WC36G]|nr:hypothetical protein LJT99_05355 [Lentisphaerae bacterium WC36]UDQ99281.1 hypothetical protein LJT99_07025 [Lentisphaerae bacterium WC36]